MFGDLDVHSPEASAYQAWRMLLAPLIGALVGAVTSVGQAHLDRPWSALVNSASPWLLGGFAAGALQPRPRVGAAAGLAACVAEVVGYYAVTSARGFAVTTSEIVFWSACAVVGGPLFGWAGWAWRRGPDRLARWGAALAPATFLAEAIGTYQLRLHEGSTVVLYLLIGLALGGFLTITSAAVRRAPATASVASAVAIGVGLLCYGPLLSAAGGVAFG